MAAGLSAATGPPTNLIRSGSRETQPDPFRLTGQDAAPVAGAGTRHASRNKANSSHPTLVHSTRRRPEASAE